SFVLAQISFAVWRFTSSDRQSSAVAGIEHRHSNLQNADESATIDLAAFSIKTATLHLIDNPGGSENLAAVMGRENFVAGVNGGYFDTDFRPLGLRVFDGKTRSPLVRARLRTAALCATAHQLASG